MTTPSQNHILYIDTPELLESFAERCAQADRIAVDTEADSLHHYFEKCCLIQISVGDTHGVVDPLVLDDLSPLLDVLAEKAIIFHGADYDLRMLRQSHGFEPRGEIIDTMLAGQLLGFEQLGLAALALKYFDVVLSKHGQKSDWSKRPLPPDLIEYAANDTRYLEALADKLLAELDALDRRAWHREACERAVATSLLDNERDPETVWRIKGAGALKGRGLAILRELWYWRDDESQRVDRPPFMVAGNQLLVAITEWAMEHPRADVAHNGPKLPRNCKGRRLAALSRALERGMSLSEPKWPPLRPPKSGNKSGVRPDEKLIKKLQAARDKVAKPLDLAGSVLAPRAVLVALATHRPKSPESMLECSRMYRWQVDLLGRDFLKILT